MPSAYQSVFRPGLFAGQVAVVTGGGSGIGRCTAHELSALGAKVALVGRRIEKLEAVKSEIAHSGGEARAYACDIREEDRVRGTVAAILGDFGRIDALVNNAGGQFAAPLETISAKGWDAVVRNNLTGGFLFARECYTQWMKQAAQASGTGAIVNIIADMWHGMPWMGHSGAARAGMLNFTETAALEWAPVRVNAVAPGLIDTPMTAPMHAIPSILDPELAHIPLRRMGSTTEVAAVVAFLCTEDSSYVSGAVFVVDGASDCV